MKNNLEYIIKGALLDEANRYSSEEDLYCRIKERIAEKTDKRIKFYIGTPFLSSVLKKVSVSFCIFVVCIMLAFTASSQVRAFAFNAVSSLKTIFVIEVAGDKVQAVEKPVDEIFITPEVAKTTFESDDDLGELFGFKFKYPDSFGKSLKKAFTLYTKNSGIILTNPIAYESGLALDEEILNAINNEDAFKKLSKYGPARTVCGYYSNDGHRTFSITITHAWSLSEQLESWFRTRPSDTRKVMVGELNGYWKKVPMLGYPCIVENGYPTSDLSVEPKIEYYHALLWEKDKVVYTLIIDKEYQLSLKDSIKIAKEFMESNK